MSPPLLLRTAEEGRAGLWCVGVLGVYVLSPVHFRILELHEAAVEEVIVLLK